MQVEVIPMIELEERSRPACVIGPVGEPLTLETLPPQNTRWVARRKAEVVAAVDGGLLTIAEACERYLLTAEEFSSWQRDVGRSGLKGLHVSRIQFYRQKYESAGRAVAKPAGRNRPLRTD